MTSRYILWLLAISGLPCVAQADDSADTRRQLLQEGGRQTQQYRDSGWLGGSGHAAHDVEADDGYIRINGQIYAVGTTAQELESAFYHALNARQWHKVQQFSARYAALPEHKRTLLQLAAALAARAKGDYTTALAELEAAAAAEPDNVRISLELARAYTEDNRNREATATFRRVAQANIPEETRTLVQQYLRELDKRGHWHGQASIGYGYNDNINQGNGEVVCVAKLADLCLMERSLPRPVSSAVVQYSATALKTQPLAGNHSLHLRGVAYGSHYPRKDTQQPLMPDNSYHSVALYMGYDYANVRSHFTLLPYVEYDYRNRHSHYHALGADAEWSHTLSPRWRVNAHAGGKRYRYSAASSTYFANYSQYELGVGAEWAASRNWGLFANIDATRKAYASAVASSQEYALRLGAYKLFANGAYLNALWLHRRTRHDAAGFTSEGLRRRDMQNTAVLALGLRQWQHKDIYPELRVKHTHNRSNASFYRYRQNEIMLNLRYRF